MKNLIIMAAGASSRMKKSLDQVNLSSDVRQVAISQHKSLIPVDKTGKSLLFYLCTNAKKAGYESIYLLTSINNKPFYDWVKKYNSTSELNEVKNPSKQDKAPWNGRRYSTGFRSIPKTINPKIYCMQWR